MKKLAKKSKIEIQLKLEKFFKEQLWQHIIVIAFVSFCAWLFDKPIEAILFCISHLIMRPYFDKQYHCLHEIQALATYMCLTLTCTIAFFGIAYCLPLTLSLLSTIAVSCFICWVGYLAQDKIDYKIMCKELQTKLDNIVNELNEYKNIDLYKMSEDDLRQYGASQQLSEVQQDILCMRVLQHLKISEIVKYYKFGRSTIKYHIAEIKKKLKIDKI